MNGRALNDNNDIEMDPITKSVRRISSLKERTMRLLSTTLHTFQGECFVDFDAGVPWFNSILGNSILFIDEIGAEIKDKILAVDGVSKVVDMAVAMDGRNIKGRYKVVLSDGSTLVNDF